MNNSLISEDLSNSRSMNESSSPQIHAADQNDQNGTEEQKLNETGQNNTENNFAPILSDLEESKHQYQTNRELNADFERLEFDPSSINQIQDGYSFNSSILESWNQEFKDAKLGKRIKNFKLFNYGKAPVETNKLEFRPIRRHDNKHHYIGQYVKGKKIRQGIGIEISENYSIYEGWWKNDKKHGLGRLVDADGTVYEGRWEKGISKGFGIYTKPDGFKWANYNWNDQQMDGYGFCLSPDGTM